MAWSAFGAIAAIAVAGLLVPVRSTIDNTNVALILVLVVVAAATFGGRTAGVVTSIVSALSFNYFQTEPYYTLRISDRDDIVSAVLLLVVGLAVGEIAVLARRRQVVAVTEGNALDRLFDPEGYSRVAGTAALLPPGPTTPEVVSELSAAGVRAVLVQGPLPAGSLGLDDPVDVPIVGIPFDAATKLPAW